MIWIVIWAIAYVISGAPELEMWNFWSITLLGAVFLMVIDD